MSQEILEMVQGMDLRDLGIQLALQCAPLIAGLKMSNLLIVHRENLSKIQQILNRTGISFQVLLTIGEKMTILLYCEKSLEQYLNTREVADLLLWLGYQSSELSSILPIFKKRYQEHLSGEGEFPHEMGLLLGYPVEDVKGFIFHEGKNSLYVGYWKVYQNPGEKKKLFYQFEKAQEHMLRMVSGGMSIMEIIHSYQGRRRMNGYA